MRPHRWLALAVPAIAACSLVNDWDRFVGDPAAPPSASFEDARGVEDARRDVEPEYHSFSDESRWESFDLTRVHAGAIGYGGGVYDGRYVYFAPKGRVALRHDAERPLDDLASWEAIRFDFTADFFGAVFDGRYVYFGPDSGLLVARFDIVGVFQNPASWRLFSLRGFFEGLDAGGPSYFRGVLWAGQDEITFVPADSTPGNDAVVRYRRSGDFTDAGSWSRESLGAPQATFYGGAVVKDVTILVPSRGGQLLHSGGVAASDGGWAPIAIPPPYDKASFFGAVYDGRYLYFAPDVKSPAARVDPELPLAASSAWTSSNAPIDAGTPFYGGSFDGRYVYYAPALVTSDEAGTTASYTQFDTTRPFDASEAWTRFRSQTMSGGAAAGHRGAVFGGRYVYFSPSIDSSRVVRFHARSAPPEGGVPPGHGRHSP